MIGKKKRKISFDKRNKKQIKKIVNHLWGKNDGNILGITSNTLFLNSSSINKC